MPRCEDFPCCGHTDGDPCPSFDAKGQVIARCSQRCGRRLPKNATSSICRMCLRRLQRAWERGEDGDEIGGDHDYSMNF